MSFTNTTPEPFTLSPETRAVALAASKDSTRPTLAFLYLAEGRAIATDGHCLVSAPADMPDGTTLAVPAESAARIKGKAPVLVSQAGNACQFDDMAGTKRQESNEFASPPDFARIIGDCLNGVAGDHNVVRLFIDANLLARVAKALPATEKGGQAFLDLTIRLPETKPGEAYGYVTAPLVAGDTSGREAFALITPGAPPRK